MNKEKIAILSILIWGAIKQRGQFIAELLSKDFDVDYIQFKGVKTVLGLNRHLFINRHSSIRNLKVKKIFRINVHKISNPIIKKIADCINYFFVLLSGNYNKYEFVWITHPLMYYSFKEVIPNDAKIIYDCADDWLEFNNTVMSPELLLESEKELLLRSQTVFCSANYLREKLITRYGIDKEIYVVNNAIGIPSNPGKSEIPYEVKEIINEISAFPNPLIYIGTISDWFDFDTMIKMLDRFPQLCLILIGPCEIVLPHHKRIKYYGIIDRQYVFNIMELALALVMPFKLNELIKSVNPVKLYEYIYMGKPIIVPSYGESQKFLPFVNLYHSDLELEDILNNLIEGKIKQLDIRKCRDYVNNNRWEDRYEQMKQAFMHK